MPKRGPEQVRNGGSDAGWEYAEVAAALPVFRTFTYRIPGNLAASAAAGKRVLVPFGRRRATGYLLGPAEPGDLAEIKPVYGILDEAPIFPAGMIPFFRWISDYYIHPLGEVIRSALPGGLNPREREVFDLTLSGAERLSKGGLPDPEARILACLGKGARRSRDLKRLIGEEIPESVLQSLRRSGWIERRRELKAGKVGFKSERCIAPGEALSAPGKLSPTAAEIVRILAAEGEITVSFLNRSLPGASRLLPSLEKAGRVRICAKPVYRDPFGEPIPPDTPPVLSTEQEEAFRSLSAALGKGYGAFLLSGVTGSGKTEVYLRMTEAALAAGASVLVLVPEIALITQMERRFRARFGERVAVLHSALSPGERYDQWMRILRREASVAVGARSAIFAPFERIGLVIVDEEHDTSYKQEGGLRYNARDLALVRAKLDRGAALLGSATPSIQSFHNAVHGKFREIVLSKRIEARTLPEVTIVDLRRNRDRRGIGRFISDELKEAMREALRRREQILLFLNRRGFAGFPVCGDCGEPMRCRNCDISLTLHRAEGVYKCHYCGFSRDSASACPACGAARLRLLGIGTEKIEAAVKALFPEARVARMDRDTTGRKGAVLKILKGLNDRTVDILIGTQMVAKGHDFPHITLVGIVCADLSLSFPDFRAGERTFQLLAQVSGRAGRGDLPGKVILQTYNPAHFCILSAREHDFREFYRREILFRKELNYPPFSRMAQVRITGREKEMTGSFAADLGSRCARIRKKGQEIEVLGPLEAPIPRIAGEYRWQLLIKAKSAAALNRFLRGLLFEDGRSWGKPGIGIAVDVDPLFML